MRANPAATISTFADILGVPGARVRLWTFARAAAEPRTQWHHDPVLALARSIAP
jgi:hypothetical protein